MLEYGKIRICTILFAYITSNLYVLCCYRFIQLISIIMLKGELVGNLGADAKEIQDNNRVFVSMNVASSYRRLDPQTGQPIDVTQWVSVTLPREGGNLLPYLKKGTKIFVRGNLSTRIYMGHDGLNHSGINISASEIELCGGVKNDEAGVQSEEIDK
jgi:single-strand DNA-binding protein